MLLTRTISCNDNEISSEDKLFRHPSEGLFCFLEGTTYGAGYRVYDHRVKQAIAATRNPYLFPQLSIPRSTALTRIRKGVRDVVTMADLDADRNTLLEKISNLERTLQAQIARNDLVVFTFRVFGLQIQSGKGWLTITNFRWRQAKRSYRGARCHSKVDWRDDRSLNEQA